MTSMMAIDVTQVSSQQCVHSVASSSSSSVVASTSPPTGRVTRSMTRFVAPHPNYETSTSSCALSTSALLPSNSCSSFPPVLASNSTSVLHCIEPRLNQLPPVPILSHSESTTSPEHTPAQRLTRFMTRTLALPPHSHFNISCTDTIHTHLTNPISSTTLADPSVHATLKRSSNCSSSQAIASTSTSTSIHPVNHAKHPKVSSTHDLKTSLVTTTHISISPLNDVSAVTTHSQHCTTYPHMQAPSSFSTSTLTTATPGTASQPTYTYSVSRKPVAHPNNVHPNRSFSSSTTFPPFVPLHSNSIVTTTQTFLAASPAASAPLTTLTSITLPVSSQLYNHPSNLCIPSSLSSQTLQPIQPESPIRPSVISPLPSPGFHFSVTPRHVAVTSSGTAPVLSPLSSRIVNPAPNLPSLPASTAPRRPQRFSAISNENVTLPDGVPSRRLTRGMLQREIHQQQLNVDMARHRSIGDTISSIPSPPPHSASTPNTANITIQRGRPTNQPVVPLPQNVSPFVARNYTSHSRPHLLGPMDIPCRACGALHFAAEKSTTSRADFNMCCNMGKVVMRPFQNFPLPLRQLYQDPTLRGKQFRKNIRNYNSGLAMSSMIANVDPHRGGGPYCFRVHGQVYHCVGALRPASGTSPQYAQVLIMDTEDAADELVRNPVNSECNSTTFAFLHRLLTAVNPFVQAFLMMNEVLRDEESHALSQNRPQSHVRMVFDQAADSDSRRYNVASANEVAIVYVGDDEYIPGERQLVIHDRSGRLQTINYLNSLCDPLTYPLLFPTGEHGWHSNIFKTTTNVGSRVRVTQKEFYSYLFFDRLNLYNPLLSAGKLFQQFVVDSWLKIEMNRLNFIKQNQNQLRLDTVRGLHDYMLGDDDNSGPPGRRIVLAASFSGGPRHMIAQYQDAMSIVSKYGKPDVFLTFTCNPYWPEITNNLHSDQVASDRPDIVARVFNLKVKALCHELFKKNAFGEVAAYIYVIEFQKRGLPHMHMLITFKQGSKLISAEDVDSLISAEIPDRSLHPELFEIVSKNMMHRPCGVINPHSPCMKDGVCTKRYPKHYRNETSLFVDGYPEYRRRNDGRFVMCRGTVMDNRSVVPYSPYLTTMFQAHINVEVCALIHVIKYVYKYVYKGSDRARLRLMGSSRGDEQNEIRSYIDARYVCAPEAMHRIFGFKMQDRSVSVVRLQVHLPGFESITFLPGAEHTALEMASTRFSTLTGFFSKNASCAAAVRVHGRIPEGMLDSRTYHYVDMPEHFLFQNGWKERKRSSSTIGRMHFVSPQDSERFALRLLLLYGRGFTSFEDVRTFNGTLYPSFVATARAAGYLSDDTFYEQSLREAALLRMSPQLRSYFVSLIMFGGLHPPIPEQLWNMFKRDFMDDFLRAGLQSDVAEARSLHDVAERLSFFGKEWHEYFHFDLPPLPEPFPIDYDHHGSVGETLYASLNDEQRAVVDAVFSSLQSPGPQCFFLDGPGGSGKTYVYTTIYHLAIARRHKVLTVAWTGIAANLLPNGRTATSAFRLIVGDQSRSSSMKRQSREAKILHETDIIIWDEAPMAPKQALETVDSLLQDIAQLHIPFAGKVMLLGGDFRQVLPVVERGSRSEMVQSCIKSSALWPMFRTFRLTINMRVQDSDLIFKNWLLDMGDGNLTIDANCDLPVPPQYVCHTDIVDAVFADVFTGQSSDLSDTVILTPRNVDALRINDRVLDNLDGVKQSFISEDEAIVEQSSDAFHFPTEFLNKMTPTGLPPHELHLKVGCIVMLLRNLDVGNGLCNGTRFIIRHIGRRVVVCEHATGSRKGSQVLIPRIDCYYTHQMQPFKLRRRQFPLRLSFAMTINKSQGQSFSRVGIALHDPIFSHGQLYVAFSRARTSTGIFVEATENVMRNIVYTEVLR